MSFVINVPTDLAPSKPQGSAGPVPKGNYPVALYDIKAEEVKSGANAGKPRWNVQLRVTEGQYENRRFFAYIPLYVAGDFWKTQSFFEALGYDLKGAFTVPEINDILGKPLVARVTIREAEGQYEAENNVAGFNPAKPAGGADNLLASGATPVNAADLWVQ